MLDIVIGILLIADVALIVIGWTFVVLMNRQIDAIRAELRAPINEIPSANDRPSKR